MEFTRLADVAVVETATDDDKVLIEQNGEIKRVPKTEVGGSGNMLIVTHAGVTDSTVTDMIFTTNMTLTEAVEAFNKQELTGGVLYFASQGDVSCMQLMVANITATFGFECMLLMCEMMDMQLFWSADGFSTNPPM